jgi:nucleoside-triphosphatase THEP1
MQHIAETPKIAAIITDDTDRADVTLFQFAENLSRLGYAVDGVVQTPSSVPSSRCNAELHSLSSGATHSISQKLGSCSVSCSLDVEALEKLALQLRNSIDAQTQMIIINRFGKRECNDGGFCCVIERAVELGVPVLTILHERFKQSWLDYGGQQVTLLDDEPTQLQQWASAVLSDSASDVQAVSNNI